MQLASLTAVKVYVFVDDGDTLISRGLLVIPLIVTGVVPSVYVILQGCVPVNATERFVEPPAQMLAVPLKIAVGAG